MIKEFKKHIADIVNILKWNSVCSGILPLTKPKYLLLTQKKLLYRLPYTYLIRKQHSHTLMYIHIYTYQ